MRQLVDEEIALITGGETNEIVEFFTDPVSSGDGLATVKWATVEGEIQYYNPGSNVPYDTQLVEYGTLITSPDLNSDGIPDILQDPNVKLVGEGMGPIDPGNPK